MPSAGPPARPVSACWGGGAASRVAGWRRLSVSELRAVSVGRSRSLVRVVPVCPHPLRTRCATRARRNRGRAAETCESNGGAGEVSRTLAVAPQGTMREVGRGIRWTTCKGKPKKKLSASGRRLDGSGKNSRTGLRHHLFFLLQRGYRPIKSKAGVTPPTGPKLRLAEKPGSLLQILKIAKLPDSARITDDSETGPPPSSAAGKSPCRRLESACHVQRFLDP